MKWGWKINSGQLSEKGKALDRVLSCLELLGPLLALSAGAQWLQGSHAQFFVDNDGAVNIWRKGYSTTCPLSSSVVKAIATVAAAIGCRVQLCMVTRCSDTGPILADALSKGKFQRFRDVAKEAQFKVPYGMAPVPRALLEWVSDPREDDFLGDRILTELCESMLILGRNY